MSKGKSLIKLTTGSEKLLFFMPAITCDNAPADDPPEPMHFSEWNRASPAFQRRA
jgi:hypothetical protein